MDDQGQQHPYGLLPDLRRFSSSAALHFPSYHPNLLTVQPPGSIPPAIYSEPILGVNIISTDGVPLAGDQRQRHLHQPPFVGSSGTGTTTIGGTATMVENMELYGQSRENNVLSMDLGGGGGGGGGGCGSNRWPRQETLTLLDIRSRLANKFREANQKGPLWDEVSRIMLEEHGYQRSGKKCREKFENLYKYYKKTKEGKAGRQDGKSYRFFRQLEAIYGESSVHGLHEHNSSYDNPPLGLLTNIYPVPGLNVENETRVERFEAPQYSPSISNSMSDYCQFDLSSSTEENNGGEGELSVIASLMAENKKMRRPVGSEGKASKSSGGGRKKGWKEKVKSFVDAQVRRLVEKQEDWMDKMLRTIESNEQERLHREMEWRDRETARLERERELWAKKRAWMEARDTAFMDAMSKFAGKEAANVYSLLRDRIGDEDEEHERENLDKANLSEGVSSRIWQEHEILSFIQVMTSMEQCKQLGSDGSGHFREGFWELIEAKMGCFGYSRSAAECRDKWENISNSFRKITDRNRKNGEVKLA